MKALKIPTKGSIVKHWPECNWPFSPEELESLWSSSTERLEEILKDRLSMIQWLPGDGKK